jgi:hypothetical protein
MVKLPVAVSKRSTVRRLVVAAAVALLAFAGASVARAADSISLTVVDGSGGSDPAAELSSSYTFSGTTSAPRRVHGLARPAGGPPCAAQIGADSGTALAVLPLLPLDSVGVGNFSFTKSGRWVKNTNQEQLPAGQWQVCLWLVETTSSNAVAVSSTTISLREVRGSISMTASPPNPYPGQLVTLTFAGTVETNRVVAASIRPAGGEPCARMATADLGKILLQASGSSGITKQGNYSVPLVPERYERGRYQICSWLTNGSTDQAPIAASTSFLDVQSLVTSVSGTMSALTGRRVKATGRVASPSGVPRGTCLLQRKVGLSWKTAGRGGSVRANGACAVISRLPVAGRARVRLVFRPASDQWAASKTSEKTLRVRP